MRCFLRALTAASLVATATIGSSAIIILQGPGNIEGDENVLFNEDGLLDNGLVVQGITNETGFIVNFEGTEILNTPSGGQARIEADDGAYTSLDIFLDDAAAAYTSLILNINAVAEGMVMFDITPLVGSNFVTAFSLDGNGENFFRIIATDGDYISTSSFATTIGVADIRQVRIGGSTTEFPPEEVVPEPATVGMACAAVGLALLRKRRKSA